MPIDANEDLVNQISTSLQNDFIAKEAILKEKSEKLNLKLKNQEKLYESKLFEMKHKLKKELYLDANNKAEEENRTKTDLLNREIDRKNNQLENFRNLEVDFEKTKIDLNQKYQDDISKIKKNHLIELQNQSEASKKIILDDYELKIRELEKKLENQKILTEEQKRKLEQGSMQIQGEVQEEAIEDFLTNSFPQDNISLIKKGTRGADCLQIVNSKNGSKCGSIFYESKRTRSFKNEWINKLREDMQTEKADIGVLVTKTLPKDQDRMKFINGIYICTFEEFKGLSHILRTFIEEFYKTKISKENITDKKQLLYNYLVSKEFQIQVHNILELFNEKKENLNKDYNYFIKSYKRRQGNYDSLSELIISFFGRVEGISGSNIKPIENSKKIKVDDVSNIELLKSFYK